IDAPGDVKQILKTSCYNCHSNQTKLAWFDQMAPAYWLVSAHVNDARKALNFSHWDSLAPPAQKAALFLAVNQVLFKEMPRSDYTLLHPGAKLSDMDISILKTYVRSLAPYGPSDTSAVHAAARQYDDWISHGGTAVRPTVKPALNGIQYIDGYNNWKAISTTDRFDNGTIRVVFGNDMAVKAIEEGNINPWPDGTIFAKVAWNQLTDTAGIVRSGTFSQVEFMIKDSRQYASTRGWGWARWKGIQLVPYGKDAHFANECVSCHQPLKNTDFVFTAPLQLSKPAKQ
ncbi:MAG TPA: cytochrome P460 family protein, partial [Chitinophagaceae bacterium]|nr:cytochrome P460 family protein [Chitinophagaceae bacterium]